MQKTNIHFILVFGFFLFAASCAKEGPNGPTGPAGPSYTGNISGHVSLYDQYGSPVLTGLNKVQITLGTTPSIYPDATGLYSYTSIVTGNYIITAADTGYAPTVLNTVQFVSGTLYRDIKLSAIPGFAITGFTAAQSSVTANDSLVINVNADTRIRRCILFVNSASTVSNDISNHLFGYIIDIPANNTTVTVSVPAQDLYNANITSGRKVYYAVYSYVVNDASVYEDFTTGKKVYNAVSNPLIDSAIAP